MRICFLASKSPKAQEALKSLKSMYKHHPPSECDVVVALGGDGFMIQVIHKLLGKNIPIYGMNRGNVGFLLNDYKKTNLEKRIKDAVKMDLHSLQMQAVTKDRKVINHCAVNEVSLMRHTNQTAHIQISIDDQVVIEDMQGDGVLVATPAGSTAYNASAYGPILPLQANCLAITPLSPFCPRRWGGAIIPDNSVVTFKILQSKKRPVNASADFNMVRNISKVTVRKNKEVCSSLLFDPHHNLEYRMTLEQFS